VASARDCIPLGRGCVACNRPESSCSASVPAPLATAVQTVLGVPKWTARCAAAPGWGCLGLGCGELDCGGLGCWGLGCLGWASFGCDRAAPGCSARPTVLGVAEGTARETGSVSPPLPTAVQTVLGVPNCTARCAAAPGVFSTDEDAAP
jgi:hypothetical protein